MDASSPLIGIPCATYVRQNSDPLVHGNHATYLRAVERAGGVPVLIPLLEHPPALRPLFERLDGLLLAGGADVDPAHYHEAPHPRLGRVNAPQDAVELLLLEWACAAQMPVLGICRGFQLINVAFGGSLFQDLPAQHGTQLDHAESDQPQQRDLLAHGLRLDPTSQLAGLLGGSELAVNTLHHQGVRVLGHGLVATGWAPDGLVEALESADAQWLLAVQGHPEELFDGADTRWSALFTALVQASRTWQSQRSTALQ